ncbi:MAG: efflux RND transporter periplasmic adaptor subunit [Tannerella sp.]|jgi:Cu(I)/Ag(I) efflux system membrane fusion protein|nr:efflux RND transporter periplasmic adaptor subunit [Tannerella sp.]
MTKKVFIYGLVFAAGLLLGWLIFSSPADGGGAADISDSGGEAQVWTCSMHPQIRQDKPGKCRLCAMDLIPLHRDVGGSVHADDPDAIMLSAEAVALANIMTTKVSRGNAVKEISLFGTVKPDERLVHSQVSHVGGRIEKLVVNFVGETVRNGQVIAQIYSPELQNAQQELLEAVRLKSSQPALLEAVREKLRLLKFSDSQIAKVEQAGKVEPQIDITANTNGIVMTKNVAQGDYVGQGDVLFNVADLSSVWVLFDAYEADLPFLKVGNKVTYTVPALPERTFSGRITFIDPILDKASRTARVRVESSNQGLQLKPEMYVNAIVEASMGKSTDEIIIPKTAVLWTGKRSIVYVRQPDMEIPSFKLREVELGAALGDSYVIKKGLDENEEVVTNGAFTIDASAQLEGKMSMMSMENEGLETENFRVGGLCDMCKERIETAAKSVSGVQTATWDGKTQILKINFNPKKTSKDKVSEAVAASGHDTDKHRADDAVYAALPECCHYRK